MNPILFVSSNNTWGGSEILWSDTAALLAEKGYPVTFAVKYAGRPVIKKLIDKGASYLDLSNTVFPSRLERVLRKLKLSRVPKETFLQSLLDNKPQLVVISQGNNVDGRYYMTACREQGVPYLTVTQLVTEVLWLFIDDDTINELRRGYNEARINYFVSNANLQLHNAMVGDTHTNTKIANNPFTVPVEGVPGFPKTDGNYHIALVARLETFHKGQDILLKVLQQPKWKERPVTFNFYGTGPHRQLLERFAEQYGITNVVFKGHVDDVANVWANNHLLILPSRMEGQSLALIEAMWCSRGAVVTDVGGACELIKDEETGFVAPAPTVNDVDAALEKAWRSKDQWEEIGKKAGKKIREVYQRNPISAFSDEIIGVLEGAHLN